jgi:phage-related protein
MDWRVVVLNDVVAAEIEALPVDIRARLTWIVTLLEANGPLRVREPYVKPLGDKLWEMRMKGRDGIARAIYIAASGRRLVILHAFVKKTEKTPRAALELARRRAQEIV